jgi:type II secretory pathway pseudopilin PulG
MAGFTFLGLMGIISILGVALLAVGEVWGVARQREKEQELLFVGDQFRRAITAYYIHAPNKQQPYPTSLEDLLKDPRYPATRRYLRRMYRDPVTGSAEWGLMKRPNGGIFGVYSLSDQAPIKRSNFGFADREFSGKAKYADWIFMHVPPQLATGPVVAP